MTRLVIAGHGNYGTAMAATMAMLMGESDGVAMVDFGPDDDINTLTAKIEAAADYDGEVLFACDLAGGSPFRQSAMLCTRRPKTFAVAGLNVAAYVEMVNNLEMPAEELMELGIEVAQETILRFPEKSNG